LCFIKRIGKGSFALRLALPNRAWLFLHLFEGAVGFFEGSICIHKPNGVVVLIAVDIKLVDAVLHFQWRKPRDKAMVNADDAFISIQLV
jgi:hypothetical protein